MKGLRLIATGGALPGRTVTNEELRRTVDTLQHMRDILKDERERGA